MQVTTGLPLAAIYDLYYNLLRGPSGKQSDQSKIFLTGRQGSVTTYDMLTMPAFFQATPGLSPSDVTLDAAGFFSLILSVAKFSTVYSSTAGADPKYGTPFMPRTDFGTIWKIVKGEIPGMDSPGSLWTVVKTLLCYKNVIQTDG